MHRIMKAIGKKKSEKNIKKGQSSKRTPTFKMLVILSKYLISKIAYIDMDAKIQGVKTSN